MKTFGTNIRHSRKRYTLVDLIDCNFLICLQFKHFKFQKIDVTNLKILASVTWHKCWKYPPLCCSPVTIVWLRFDIYLSRFLRTLFFSQPGGNANIFGFPEVLKSIVYIVHFYILFWVSTWALGGGGRYKNGPFVLGKILEGKKKGADLPQCFRVVVVASCIGWWRWWVGKSILDLLRISLKCLRFRLFTIFVLLCFFLFRFYSFSFDVHKIQQRNEGPVCLVSFG